MGSTVVGNYMHTWAVKWGGGWVCGESQVMPLTPTHHVDPHLLTPSPTPTRMFTPRPPPHICFTPTQVSLEKTLRSVVEAVVSSVQQAGAGQAGAAGAAAPRVSSGGAKMLSAEVASEAMAAAALADVMLQLFPGVRGGGGTLCVGGSGWWG